MTHCLTVCPVTLPSSGAGPRNGSGGADEQSEVGQRPAPAVPARARWLCQESALARSGLTDGCELLWNAVSLFQKRTTTHKT